MFMLKYCKIHTENSNLRKESGNLRRLLSAPKFGVHPANLKFLFVFVTVLSYCRRFFAPGIKK